MQLLDRWGPDGCEPMSEAAALQWCDQLTRAHRENFTVLSGLMPEAMRAGACAVYAWCRWADDLADEAGGQDASIRLLQWWREELHACFEGRASHPVLIALRQAVAHHNLELAPFDALLDAFEHDQVCSRYETYEQVLGYCRGSAEPVGRIVLQLGAVEPTSRILQLSDQVCTGLQLVNHWQDVRRDLLERDRIYIPADAHDIDAFESRLRATCTQGHAPDRTFLGAYRQLIESLCERTRPLLEAAHELSELVPAGLAPMIWLFGQGGLSLLEGIEMHQYETALFRPRVSRWRKCMLLLQARRMRP